MNVLVTGTFDCLHSGHVAFLKAASVYGTLYVGIGSTESIRTYKKKDPICTEEERLFMLKAIRYVADAWINKGKGPLDFMTDFDKLPVKIDILVVNEDQDLYAKRMFCEANGIQYIVLKREPEPGLPSRSSTVLREEYALIDGYTSSRSSDRI